MHRTAATLKRPKAHRPVRDPENVGTCKQCHLIWSAGLHKPAAVAAQEKADKEAELAAEKAPEFIDPSRARHIREEADGG